MNEAGTPINPIALQLGPLSVHWYGIIIGAGALLGLWMAMRESEKRGLKKDILLILFFSPSRSQSFAHGHIMCFSSGAITRNIPGNH